MLLLGCAAQGPRVPFRVVVLGDDPFFGTTATAIAATLERDGVRDEATTTRFAPTDPTLVLPPLPYGEGYTLVVETELSGLVLARGRSFPFAVGVNGADRAPDVSLGVLGRFAPTGLAGEAPTSIFAADDGAWLASSDGLTHFVAHAVDGVPVLGARADWPASRLGGSPVALGPGVLVVGGADPGATLVSASGEVLAELGAGALPILSGPALLTLDGDSALVLGGMHHDGSLAADVFRVAWDGVSLSATALPPLPDARTHARAFALLARHGAGPEPRVLLTDGAIGSGAATDVVLVDPAGHDAPHAFIVPTLALGAAVCPLDTGLVLMAGGHDATGAPSNEVTILVVQLDPVVAITALSPAPPTLFRARDHAIAVPLAAGLALVVGGVDALGAPVREAEIAEVRLDFIPGNVVLTGSLPSSGAVTAATRLADHTVLVSAGGTLYLYFSPRD